MALLSIIHRHLKRLRLVSAMQIARLGVRDGIPKSRQIAVS